MPYQQRVTLPSREGSLVIDLDDGTTLSQLEERYGPNTPGLCLLLLAWVSLLSDSPVDPLKPSRTLRRFFKRIVMDPFQVIKEYTELSHLLTLSVENGGEAVLINDFLVGFKKTPVFREYLMFYKTQDPLIFRYLLSFLNFGKKLYFEDERLNQVAFRKWLDVEDRLENLVLPDFVWKLRKIMKLLFEDFSPDYFLPIHGGGHVSEPGVRGSVEKNLTFKLDPKLGYMFRKNNMFLINESNMENFPPIKTEERSKTQSRLKFVPKDWKTTRSICMEPLAFQYAQQGVRLWVEDHIRSTFLGDHIVLHDQGANQRAAQFGSKTGLVDTIDLSSASDSVSWALVKSIFPANILKYLAATRTRETELPQGGTRFMAKFAPMGSALCFPIQSLVYASIVIMHSVELLHGEAVWENVRTYRDLVNVLNWTLADELNTRTSFIQPFYVYGDDIICDKRVTSNLIGSLNSLGFTVNVEKSFTGQSAFRESCGEYYLNGASVTPYFFKVKRIGKMVTVDSLAGVIDHANKARDFGYTNLRKVLVNFVLRYPIEGIPYGKTGLNPVLFSKKDEIDDRSFSLHCDTPRNSHLRVRMFNPEVPLPTTSYLYQRDEVQSIAISPTGKRKSPKELDSYYYLAWWRSRYQDRGTSSTTEAVLKADTLGTGAGWRWTPIQI